MDTPFPQSGRHRRRWWRYWVLVWMVLASVAVAEDGAGWRRLAPGLDLGRFVREQTDASAEIHIVVVRVDPALWDLRLGIASENDDIKGLSAREWCLRQGFVAAINAGMFATDYVTHIGYLQHRNHVNNPRLSRYQSMAAFCPIKGGVPRFRIFDMDTSVFSMEAIKQSYNCVVQNLRLIKRPGQNRWAPQAKTWIEAALGEDRQGRALLILSRTAHSMYELNQALLELPLDIACAQHLEGGPEAQLFVAVGDFRLEIVGGYENRFTEGTTLNAAWPLPNVIGIVARR